MTHDEKEGDGATTEHASKLQTKMFCTRTRLVRRLPELNPSF